MLLVSTSLKCHPVSLYIQAFSSYRPFETLAQNDPKMYFNSTGSKVSHTRVTSVSESQIPLNFNVRPIVKRQNLDHCKVKGTPCKCYKYPRSLNFNPFHKTSMRFPLTDYLRQVHRITPKCALSLQGQKYPIYVSQVSSSPKLDSVFFSMTRRNRVTGHCETSTPNDSTMSRGH